MTQSILRRAGVSLVAPLLSLSVACTHTTHLTYAVQARPQRLLAGPRVSASENVQGALAAAQHVVLDVSELCQKDNGIPPSRCARAQTQLAEAIRRTGREVQVVTESSSAALELARATATSVVVTVSISRHAWRTSSQAPAIELLGDVDPAEQQADERCRSELRAALLANPTHVKTGLTAHVTSPLETDVSWSYSDAVAGDVATPSTRVEIEVEAERPSSGSSRDEPTFVGTGHHHHHDHHCHHGRHHGRHDRDRREHDNEGGELIAAALLTVLVVGIVVLAASAAKRSPANPCRLLSVPPGPTMDERAHLTERLDLLLSERLAEVLGPVRVEELHPR